MPDPQGLEVHDVVVRETPSIGLTGAIGRTTVLQFHVGRHGPFIRSVPSHQATPEWMRREMADQVRALREALGGGEA